MKWSLLGDIRATRSPLLTPRRAMAWAARLTVSSKSAYVYRLSSNTKATLSGTRRALRSRI